MLRWHAYYMTELISDIYEYFGLPVLLTEDRPTVVCWEPFMVLYEINYITLLLYINMGILQMCSCSSIC